MTIGATHRTSSSELSVLGRAINIQRATRPVPLFSCFLHDELRCVGGKLIHDYIDANGARLRPYRICEVASPWTSLIVTLNGTGETGLRVQPRRTVSCGTTANGGWDTNTVKIERKQLRSFCSIFNNKLRRGENESRVESWNSPCNFMKKMDSFADIGF